MRKKVQISLIGLGILLICYLIGQKVVLPMRNFGTERQMLSAEQEKGGNINFLDIYDSLEIYGMESTLDNPWGYTVAKLEKTDELPEAILIMSGAGVGKGVQMGESAKLSFDVCIHPWVTEVSDGAILKITFDEEGTENISYSEEFLIGKDGKSLDVDLSKLSGKRGTLKIMCNSGEGGDSSGDWLALTKVELSGTTADESSRWMGESSFPEYIKGVHYFGNEWPINFWNSELNNLSEDLDQISGDGFNTIILVIPWREFQPQIEPVQYNEYALNKLETIVEAAAEAGLYVEVRIGYTWDYYEDLKESSDQRFYMVVKNEEVRSAWLNYVDKMYTTLNKYPNFIGGFITWEDFWNNTYLMDWLGDKEERIQWASEMGFQKYIEGLYAIDEVNRKYGCKFNRFEEIYIPSRNELFAKEYYAFFDSFMMDLLEESQQYFPNLSMEARTDWDVYYDGNSEAIYYIHDNTYYCGNSSYTSIMYGIPQGCENIGERLSSDEALQKTEYVLQNIRSKNNNKDIFIDQFLFYDNTPGYEMNAQIKYEEIGDYLRNVGDVLKNYTSGYAVWTYKDYKSNMIYNSQFALEEKGWSGKNFVVLDGKSGKAIKLLAEGELRQEIPKSRNHFSGNELILEFDAVEFEEKTNLYIQVGDCEIELVVKNEHNRVVIGATEEYNLTIKTSNVIVLDNVKLYSHEQNGHLYGIEEENIENIESIRNLNSKLN